MSRYGGGFEWAVTISVSQAIRGIDSDTAIGQSAGEVDKGVADAHPGDGKAVCQHHGGPARLKCGVTHADYALTMDIKGSRFGTGHITGLSEMQPTVITSLAKKKDRLSVP
jgi:hypothetical protein